MIRSAYIFIWIVNVLFYLSSDHANLLERISIGFIAGGLIFNPDFAVATYCGLKNLAATLVSRF
jgi:hypothetical protein